MKQGIPEFERIICAFIKQSYAFDVSSYEFIPVGDSAFSYIVVSTAFERRYLKVFDTSTQKGILGVEQLRGYIPLMIELKESNLFPYLPQPHYTVSGDMQCSIGRFVCVLFEYIDGETLADAYPFSDEIQTSMAIGLAKLHTVPLKSLHAQVASETYGVDFGERLQANLECLASYKDNDPFILELQSIVLPRLKLIHRFWQQLCEQRERVLQSSHELVLCHGDLWGGNIMHQTNRQLVFLDWENTIVAPIERDFFSYIGSEYATFRLAYAEERQIDLSLNPDMVAFYAYRHQLRNLNQWLHNILNENFGDEQKQNDLEMIEFHCLDRWASVEEMVGQLYKE
ncbi:aminoglycoside phosphotransferase family protein [Alicyclobacillus fodiniaquatilis]|uniref:Aminoglycoside phosphotransferase family protein n=1 Tax=Alicyclobacillus fodiniaquatilis TaxID=1661150 RepID=A0ABW4JKT6_9BACL